ncbi:RHS repeat-associated core domain-containing protein, partial [Salinibacterium sp.]|uniref:RHS repeat-associated core domain-containing protein n=1 Tax=Salinibacterium sp. TaxID=1915057 RepID=UPI00286B1C1C
MRLITDQDGDTAATSTFDEFGNRVRHSGTSDSSFGFTGAWTDADTGLVHLRARDYDPATGQFLTVDPAVDQTRQPYAYTGNNPLTRTDPTGLDAMSDAIGRGAMGLILGPGSLRVMDELNAGTDLWSSINMGYNPVYIAIERYDSFRASGNDWWAAGVMAFNPVYDVIAGFDKGLTGIQNECVEDTVTGFTQTLAGLVGTGLIAVGGVASFRSSTGSTGAAPTASSGLHSPSFVVKPNGETVVVPAGAVGPTPATGSGFQFTGGSGGPG